MDDDYTFNLRVDFRQELHWKMLRLRSIIIRKCHPPPDISDIVLKCMQLRSAFLMMILKS